MSEVARLKVGNYYRNGNSTAMSFPSSFNIGGYNTIIEGNNESVKQYNKIASKMSSKSSTLLNTIPSMNMGGRPAHSGVDGLHIGNDIYNDAISSTEVIDISQNSGRIKGESLSLYKNTGGISKSSYESVFHFDTAALRQLNNYIWQWDAKNQILVSAEKNKEKGSNLQITSVESSPSLFNPNYNVMVQGMTANVPLLNGTKRSRSQQTSPGGFQSDDISDCSIHKLVELSHKFRLGQINYRFADFMYCKDLGKVTNNYLITLRKFGAPVGDHIGYMNTAKHRKVKPYAIGYDSGSEIAHMVTWFGTDDNKLEDILKYTYQYTWKQLNSKRQDIDSKEDDSSRGLLGKIANFNPAYHAQMNAGLAGGNSFWATAFGGKIGQYAVNTAQSDQMERLRMYDNNKVYTPKQTVQDMYIPEGKLVFNHEFTLNFSYKLRAYEGINPKSAFLDLIGNVMRVTYFKGSFWGGQRNIIGPQPNNASYRKMNAFIDKAFSQMGGGLAAIANGSLNFQDVMGALSSWVSDVYDKAKEVVSGAYNEAKSNAGGFAGYAFGKLKDANDKFGIAGAVKGMLKNGLGRPSFYAFDSLLTGEDTGLWHVTIGNPRNPIAVMGNLIMTNASIQHLGPLGIDDFPTELKVTVTLKHARSRDRDAIEKMYTQGINSIYLDQQRNPVNDYYVGVGADLGAIDSPFKEEPTQPPTKQTQPPKSDDSQGSDDKKDENLQKQQQSQFEESTRLTPEDQVGENHFAELEGANEDLMKSTYEYYKDVNDNVDSNVWDPSSYAITNPHIAVLYKLGTDNIFADVKPRDQDSAA